MNWAISDWHPMKFDQIKIYDKYIIKLIESYFFLKGYNISGDGDAVNRDQKEQYYFSSFGGVMSLNYMEVGNQDNKLSLFSFIDFPKVESRYYVNVYSPSPEWAIGFIEKYIKVFNSYILPVIQQKTDEYLYLIKLNNKIFKEFQENSIFPITGEMMFKWYEENRKFEMPVNYLSKIPENKNAIKKKIINLTTAST